ncbi:MAG: acetyl-CoA C-acetyltransferase, partial [Blastocatellia bacterium]
MGETAETLARQYAISRDEQDAFALRSQQRAESATREGRFKSESIPVRIKDKKGN